MDQRFLFGVKGLQQRQRFTMGASLRDYFAAMVDTSDIPLSTYESLIGKFPAYSDKGTQQDWYALAEATYKYHRADAMLKAREAK